MIRKIKKTELSMILPSEFTDLGTDENTRREKYFLGMDLAKKLSRLHYEPSTFIVLEKPKPIVLRNFSLSTDNGGLKGELSPPILSYGKVTPLNQVDLEIISKFADLANNVKQDKNEDNDV
jgi:hypothetical protein